MVMHSPPSSLPSSLPFIAGTLTRKYTLRAIGNAQSSSYSTTVPRDFIKLAANRHGITITQLMSEYLVEWEYGIGPVATAQFVKRSKLSV